MLGQSRRTKRNAQTNFIFLNLAQKARAILKSEGYLGTLQIKKGTPVYEKMQQLRQHHVLGTRDSDRGTSASEPDVRVAHKDANRKGERQYLEDQKKDPVTFKALMDNYR